VSRDANAIVEGLPHAALFEGPVCVVAGGVHDSCGRLFPEEHLAIEGAVPGRVAEFSAGRTLARRAIQTVGGEVGAIGVRADRSPIWPKGIVGSISHSGGICVAAVSTADAVVSLGVDVEFGELQRGQLAQYVASRDELARAIETLRDPVLALRVLFSAKEALFKAQYPLSAKFLDFLDVSIDVSQQPGGVLGEFSVTWRGAPEPRFAPRSFVGRWARLGDAVATGVTCNHRWW